MSAHTWVFEAIGTTWDVQTERPLDDSLRAEVSALIDTFDQEWSRFRADSSVSQLAQGHAVDAPQDAAAMFAVYDVLDAATAGAVNPLVGDALSALGYDAAYSMNEGAAVGVPSWPGTVALSSTLTLAAPVTLDVGAIGKGRLVDRVHDHLRPRVDGALIVDASGDLRASHSPALRVALEHPYDASRAIGVVTLSDGALCASATNRRRWGDGLHHVLDARTGRPVDRIVATWALHPEAMWADALATALFFPGGAELAHAHDAAWVRMYSDGRADYRTAGADWELFV